MRTLACVLMCALLLTAVPSAEADCVPHCEIDPTDCGPLCGPLDLASQVVRELFLGDCVPHC